MNLTELTVLNSRIKEGINAEYTLDVTALKQDVSIDTLIKADGEDFRIVELSTYGCGKNIMSVHAEHISYDLNVDMPEMKGMYTPEAALNFILNGTGFTVGEVLTATAKEFRLGKMTRKQALLKVAEFFNAELKFTGHTVSLVAQRGQDRGVQLKYAKNLKAIEKIETKDGVGYKVDIVELRTILGDAEAFGLGDTVEILDETAGISTKQRVLSVDYDPLRRIHSNIEVGQREETFAEMYEKDIVEIDEKIVEEVKEEIKEQLEELDLVTEDEVQEMIDEAIQDIDIPDAQHDQIVEVTKETVLASETIHATTAWIDELEVNYLRTNFAARMANAGETWNYIYAHEMEIEFNTAQLHATEKEQYKTASGRPLYWTAIGSHADAKKYFTLQKPQIPEGSTIEGEDGQPRPLVEADFFVMVPKITSQATKMKIAFEDVGGNLIPTMIWGQGDGSENGQKCFIYKDTQGLTVRYFKTNDSTATLSLTSAGVRVENQSSGNGGQLRNTHIGTAAPQAGDMEDGDLWVVI